MNYLSEVGLVFKQSDEKLFFDKMDEWDNLHSQDTDDSARSLLYDATYEIVHADSIDEDCVVLVWTHIEWHHSFSSVEFFTEIQKEINMDFIRVGRDYDDIEIRPNLGAGILDTYTETHLAVDGIFADSYVRLHT